MKHLKLIFIVELALALTGWVYIFLFLKSYYAPKEDTIFSAFIAVPFFFLWLLISFIILWLMLQIKIIFQKDKTHIPAEIITGLKTIMYIQVIILLFSAIYQCYYIHQ